MIVSRIRSLATLAAARPEPEEGQLPGFEEGEVLRFAAFAGGGQVLAGDAPGPGGDNGRDRARSEPRWAAPFGAHARPNRP